LPSSLLPYKYKINAHIYERHVINFHLHDKYSLSRLQRRVAKLKKKVHHITCREDPEGEQRYGSTLSLTSALGIGGFSTPRSSRFNPRKETREQRYSSTLSLTSALGIGGFSTPRSSRFNPRKETREQRYSSTLSLTSALGIGGFSTPRSSRFNPRKETRYSS